MKTIKNKITKAVLATIIILASQLSFAVSTQEVTELRVFNEKLSSAQFKDKKLISASIDYSTNEAKITYFKPFICPVGAICALYTGAPEVISLPIVKINTNACGRKQVIAKKDQRPVDGLLQVIILEDSKYDQCNYFVKVVDHGSYITKGINRLTGKIFTYKSTFEVSPVR